MLEAIEAALTAERRALMQRLRAAWQAQRMHTFDAAMRSLAGSLARLACATEVVADAGSLSARLRQAGIAIGVGNAEQSPTALAQKALAERHGAEVRANTLALIGLHGLEGTAQVEILQRLASHFETRLQLNEAKAGLWGGIVSGALVGLKADLLSGGLTLGGGLLAGGLIGALGGAGLARCVNLVRGADASWVAWNPPALDQMLEAALLRYLAVAHFGRGRGDWAQGESPSHWRGAVERALQPQREVLAALWREREVGPGAAAECEASLVAALQPLLTQALRDVLHALYPTAALGESSQPPAPPSR